MLKPAYKLTIGRKSSTPRMSTQVHGPGYRGNRAPPSVCELMQLNRQTTGH
jgi:hypothetical protein